ncbi:type II toxin-antitoxin system HicB family antitoxin [Sandaracinobacteroides saxicola]|uniref:Type II toxin-antitoxin system HicB family antitoxin n=1 Tax=Sandaracinobacteroides saxicola TaxID=2759707 RepID=A0A7G5IFR6_9SPHN|nr:type II toxin-antitoxin system HicB family antitoxin [Sandaracinobacteroides saxicola]QMW22208.1 type II toxin-antitoxin system HicB family antitoxin [Sandaracinobacteroides saxicola]
MQITAVLTPAEEGGYVVYNPETGVTTQGETVDEAIANIKEAVELYLEDFPLPNHGPSLMTMVTISANA